MLNKICLEQGVELVNIVRSQKQVDMLKEIGAKIVLDSSSENLKPNFIKPSTARAQH
ncbi:hypothetical protein MGSAQ_002364 [marine sediment metagenome]|uniref:Alcohol dehydrogenase-like C-terminal domain-containing protein n=1 Tax=marine sediment metagenome TaxID=412755 RepID=A0A1B6NRR1_9ZZZZ